MLYKDYFKNNKINQVILNKKINWFYDIKSILYQEKNNYQKETYEHAKIIKNNYLEIKVKKFRKLNKSKIIINNFNKSKFLKKDKNFKKKYINLFNYLEKQKIKKYVKHFCIHGSIASDDYINGWSDFDTFVVLRDTLFDDIRSIIKLRNILKNFYKKLLNLSYFQHHGLIMYTETDLNNYLKGYLPKEALDKSFSIFGKQKIILKENYSNANLSLKSLKERKKYLHQGLVSKFYDHHTYKGKKLQIPLKAGSNQMYQLFCHLGYMLNIPILYFDATKRSIHKKKSFKKFYLEIKDKNIVNLIKKTEKIRKNWNKHKFDKRKIPRWIIAEIGEEYMKNSYLLIKKVIKLISIYNRN
jgi:hypothetical protein